jgi:hypothetical protein
LKESQKSKKKINKNKKQKHIRKISKEEEAKKKA